MHRYLVITTFTILIIYAINLNWESRIGISSQSPAEIGRKRNIKAVDSWYGVKKGPLRTFTGRKTELTLLHHFLLQPDSQTNNLTTGRKFLAVVSSGLGGIGKTELTRKFVHLYGGEFKNIVWISAEFGEQSIQVAFEKVAEELQLDLKNIKDKDTLWLVGKVYDHYKNKSSLFIFDNVESWKNGDKAIQKYLPVPIPGFQIPFILMTSRNNTWGKEIKNIRLLVLEHEDSVDLIKKCLEIKTNENESFIEIETIATLLGGLPLSMQQAMAYIITETERKWPNQDLENITVEEKIQFVQAYIDRFSNEAESKELLDYVDEEGRGEEYGITTFVTWKITIDKIKELNRNAVKFMTEMSYLGPDDITREIFTTHSFLREDELNDYISILGNYNMIHQDIQGVLSMHRLVQQVTRLRTDHTEEVQIISKLLTQFTHILEKIQQNSKSNLQHPAWILHAQILWKHALKHPTLIEEYVQFPLTLYLILDARGMYLDNLSMLGATLNVYQETGNLTEANIKLTMNMGTTNWRLQRYVRARSIEEALYEQVKSKFGETHQLSLQILGSLAATISDQGNYVDALDIYDKLIVSLTNSSEIGPNHLRTLSQRHNKGLTLVSLGRDEEALELLTSTRLLELQLQPVNRRLVLHTESWIAHILHKQGNFTKALQMYRDIYNERKELFTETHAFTLRSALGIGKCLAGLGQFKEGLDLLKQNLKLAESNENNMNTYLKIKHEIGKVYVAMSDQENAESTLRDTLLGMETLVGETHPDALSIKFDLALVLKVNGQLKEAYNMLNYVAKYRRERLGPDHTDTKTVDEYLANNPMDSV